MTMLKNDDVIKTIMWPWLLFWCFLKDFMLYHTHAKYHILGFSGSGFMEGSPFASPLGYSILKKPSLVRAKAIVRNNSEKLMFVKIYVLKMMKLGTVILYLRKIQKMYKSGDTSLEFCWHKHFFTRNQ